MMVKKNPQPVQNFLNRLNWNTNTGEMKDIDTFIIDVYRFKFDPPLEGELMTGFTGYIRNLRMAEMRSVMKIWLWLYQHEVNFTLTFAWNRRLPVRYNLKNIGKPKWINEKLKACGHEDLMSEPVEMMDMPAEKE